jgi:WD40 repeat protein
MEPGLPLSPDNRWVAAGNAGGELALWEAASGRLVLQTQAHASWLLGLAFSPDARTLCSGGGDQILRFWDVAALRDGGSSPKPAITLQGHQSEVWSVQYSANGHWVVSAGKDASARIWKPISRRRSDLRITPDRPFNFLGFSADNRAVRLVSDQGRIEHWSAENGERVSSVACPTNNNTFLNITAHVFDREVVFGRTDGHVGHGLSASHRTARP